MTLREQVLPAVRAAGITLVLTGFAYPIFVTGIAQAVFHRRANGSFVSDDSGRVVGSELIGQAFSNPAYFHPRPSAAGEHGYDASASSGSNLGPTSRKLRERAAAERDKLIAENPNSSGALPAELLTASGSGLDPHLSPGAALWQVPRVAAARRVDAERIRSLIEETLEHRDLGFLGEARVNVLTLNLALDRRFGVPDQGPATAREDSSSR